MHFSNLPVFYEKSKSEGLDENQKRRADTFVGYLFVCRGKICNAQTDNFTTSVVHGLLL